MTPEVNPVLTRRQFLVGAVTTLAAATGCRMGPTAPANPEAGAEAEAPQDPSQPRPFRIALLSDTHIQAAGSASAGAINGKLSRALADYRVLKPDLWVFDGDVSDHGLPGEFDAFKQIMKAVARPEQIVVTTGNHEFYDKEASDAVALQRFRAAFGLQQPYNNRVAGGIHLVMLADEQWKTAPRYPDWAWLTPEQVSWFEKVLAEHRDLPTVVCLHQPLQDTVLWTFGGNDFAGCGQIKELRAILARNPQVKLWLSGHTHLRVEEPGQRVVQGGVTYASLGSTFYLFDSPSGRGKDPGASQSRMLEIWPDRLLLRARDHQRQAWLDDLDVSIPRG